MSDNNEIKRGRPLNVFVAKDSAAAKHYYKHAGLPPIPEDIAKGFSQTPSHDLKLHGGRTISDLTFTNFYVGGSGVWIPGDISSIDHALASALSDRNLKSVMTQYFPGKTITSTFKNSSILPGACPNEIYSNDIETIVQNLYSAKRLNGYDFKNTVFNFMLPRGTVLFDHSSSTAESKPDLKSEHKGSIVIPKEEDDSLNGLGGYHGSVHIKKTLGKVTIYYAVGVYSEILPGGKINGIPAFDKPWKNVVATFYHELNEATTDPDVDDAIKAGNSPTAYKFIGWMDKKGNEVGDFPMTEAKSITDVMKEVPLADGTGTVPIQFMYSNAVHGPEDPTSTH